MTDVGYKIGFLGAGKMASAMIEAILRGKLAIRQDIICSDVLEERRAAIEQQLGVAVTDDNKAVVCQSDIVVLAFKPQNLPDALTGLKSVVRQDHIIVSIMAGVRIAKIQQFLPGRVVRVMPNTACLVGQMAAGFASADNVTEDDLAKVRKILQSAGVAVAVQEDELDAVTGLSGSGPAFVAYLIESFIEAGKAEGLDESIARELAIKTFEGTAKLLSEKKMTPAELIKMVSSPGGTTVAGREILESSDVSEVISQTIKRASSRSRELA